MNKVYVLWLLLAVWIALPATAQRKKDRDRTEKTEEAFREVQKLVGSRQFEIRIDRVYPLEGFDVSRFNPEGKIEIRDTSAKGHLPYFGRAYRLPYGEGGGIEFDGRMENVEITTMTRRKKRMTVSFRFTVKGFDDIFRFQVDAGPGGRCDVRLESNNRPSIAYGGEVTPISQETGEKEAESAKKGK